jgi:hypothetical protein
MAEWKKVIVSGSDANLASLQVDNLVTGVVTGSADGILGIQAINGTGDIVATTGASGVEISGSFSGSFQGDGSALTNISSTSIVGLTQIATGSVTASVNVETNAFTVASESIQLFNVRANGGVEHGNAVTASGAWSHAEGGSGGPITTLQAIGDYSHAEGYDTRAVGDYSHAEGELTVANAEGAHAEGYSTLADGDFSHTEGYFTTASGDYSHAEGTNTTAGGQYSHAEGAYTNALSVNSHAEGNTTKALGYNSHAEGNQTISGWKGFSVTSVVSGLITIADNIDYSTEFTSFNLLLDNKFYSYGTTNFTSPNFTIQLDDASVNSGNYVADKLNLNSPLATQFLGDNSHAEGNQTKALGNRSHAEGDGTTASGQTSHAEGSGTIAIGEASHAEGQNTTASGGGSHAEGQETTAYGDYSHAEGIGTIASGSTGQLAAGRYNTHNNVDSLVVIGNGTDDANRSDLALFNSQSITFNQPVTGSIFSGSFSGSFFGTTNLPDLTEGTGIEAFTYDGGATATVSVSGAASLSSDTITKWTGTAFADTSITDDGTLITFGNDAVFNGDIIVQGTASFQNTENLLVADRFVLFASGSSTAGDGGIVVQQGTQNVGELFGYENSADRWGFTSSFDAASTSYTPSAFVAAVVDVDGGQTDIAQYQKNGNIKIDGGDIWIYS